MTEFAKKLRELRTKHLMTRKDLSERSGLSVMSIRGYERAKRRPTLGHLAYLVQGLGASRDEARDLRTALIDPLVRRQAVGEFLFDAYGNNRARDGIVA
jgi:transcriptional regulator with XRE-family HTH domain